jgi:hypothetical protein
MNGKNLARFEIGDPAGADADNLPQFRRLESAMLRGGSRSRRPDFRKNHRSTEILERESLQSGAIAL